MLKKIIQKTLFKFDPEVAHNLSFKAIKLLDRCPTLRKVLLAEKRSLSNDPRLEREVFGLKFKHPVGLAAGFDKDAKLFNELGNLGFAFVEIGTVTPKAQPGNPKKRLFRLEEDEAIINRMGFNNDGVEAAKKRLIEGRGKVPGLIIGGNIGKNKSTSNDRALEDYLIAFNALFEVVDYFVINVSSPNTPNLRALQDREPLLHLLTELQRENLAKTSPKPILLKIAPDLNEGQLRDIIAIIEESGIAGVIATNTTLDRDNLRSKHQGEAGGLSGKPLTQKSLEVIRFLHRESGGAFPIIAVGGIHSAEDALAKLEAGASLLQLYTGFIYEGPELIEKINRALLSTQNLRED